MILWILLIMTQSSRPPRRLRLAYLCIRHAVGGRAGGQRACWWRMAKYRGVSRLHIAWRNSVESVAWRRTSRCPHVSATFPAALIRYSSAPLTLSVLLATSADSRSGAHCTFAERRGIDRWDVALRDNAW
jgi:hypothetical protein